MREILFRGKKWEKSVFDETDWIYGSLIDSGNHEQVAIYPWFEGASSMSVRQLVHLQMEGVIPETVGQYTGLTDKNGKKIFEGDIVKSYNAAGKMDGIGVVHWSNLFVSWHISENRSMYSGCIAFYEVIGNIHDNPKLLEDMK